MIYIARFLTGILFILLLTTAEIKAKKHADFNGVTTFNPAELQEVYLVFSHHAIGRQMVIGYYLNGEVLLPISELFTTLKIPHEMNVSDPEISGNLPGDPSQFSIHFNNLSALSGDTKTTLNKDDFIIGEFDIYLRSGLFDLLFGLDFQIDMSRLTLRLITSQPLPVIEQFEQRQRRGQYQPNQTVKEEPDLWFGRERRMLGGAMLDYTLTSGMGSRSQNLYNYSLRGGAELLGGDIQGGITGVASQNFQSHRTNDVRWRYAMPDNPWLTSASIGQLYTSGGLINRNFTGVQLSNQPVVPRVLFDDYKIDGTTMPRAEVEIYINQRLADVQTADDLGNYSLTIPITYGTTDVRIITYSPDGRINEEQRRIQIPFTFIPRGELNYMVSGGLTDRPLPGRDEVAPLAEGFVGYGITNRLTAKTGISYIDDDLYGPPVVYGSVSSRIAGPYLLGVSIAPGHYYRLDAGAYYPNNINWNINYSRFSGSNAVFAQRFRDDHQLRGNIFVPFQIRGLQAGFRLQTNHRRRQSLNQTRYTADVNLRVGGLLLRFGHRDLFIGTPSRLQTRHARYTAAAIYSFSRAGRTHFLRGLMLRGQIEQNRNTKKIDQLTVQASRSFSRAGRFRLLARHYPAMGFTTFEAGLTFNFDSFRSTSTIRSQPNGVNYRQTLHGSVHYDTSRNELSLSNRQHVGRAAASVRMFVDVNQTGIYNEEEGDYLIHDSAVRLTRAGGIRQPGRGVTRFTQLQAYKNYHFEIDKSAIRNPMLVPSAETFALKTDPNQTKPVDIPFYMAGVVEGRVDRERNEKLEPVSGIRIHLKQLDGKYETTIRTYSGGTFYKMEVPPGRYTARVDEAQLEYIQACPVPGIIEFEIKPSARGDFVEDLYFRLGDCEADK